MRKIFLAFPLVMTMVFLVPFSNAEMNERLPLDGQICLEVSDVPYCGSGKLYLNFRPDGYITGTSDFFCLAECEGPLNPPVYGTYSLGTNLQFFIYVPMDWQFCLSWILTGNWNGSGETYTTIAKDGIGSTTVWLCTD